MASGPPLKNFWLWGSWSKRNITAPFLTQKIFGKIRDVIIGSSYIVALREDGSLTSWGEDKSGCLGLGSKHMNSSEPRKIQFPTSFNGKIVDVQSGSHHLLALTSKGEVYSWGSNAAGQLGLNDMITRFEPVFVQELQPYTVVQIIAVDNMSYALTSHGVVYAWGENKDGCLALEHETPIVLKPEPMMGMRDTSVKKIAIKQCGGSDGDKATKVIVAFVELADPLSSKDQIGGIDQPLGLVNPEQRRDETKAITDETEKDIFEGVDLMRRVMDNTQDWWSHILDVRHGGPYDDNPIDSEDRGKADSDRCTTQQLDNYVGLDRLERASYELDLLIQSAKVQLMELRSKKGTKNVKFMLTLFMDDCMLRREKIRRTVAARQLMDHMKGLGELTAGPPGQEDAEPKGGDPTATLNATGVQVTRLLNRIRALKTYDIYTKSLQESLTETLECKLQVLDNQLSLLNASGQPVNPSLSSLRTIKERWGELKRFSIYNLFQECSLKGQNLGFGSDEEMLAFLVQTSDSKINQIIEVDQDRLVSRDPLVPGLCYDLLVENAELRKMCNTYQMKVLLMRHHGGGDQLAVMR